MVSADNLNYDVLSLIFGFLGNNDLVSTCLVSQSFRASATPRLYRKVYFRLDQMKQWPKIQSPFISICENPGLARHVHHCEIKSLPKNKGQHGTPFMMSCLKAFRMFTNLASFTCLVNVGPFLPVLSGMERLAELRLHSALNLEQTKALSRVQRLQRLTLLEPSLGVCHELLRWIPRMSATLTSVKITNSRDLNEAVLETIVKALPHLRSLHILGCPKISHQTTLRLINFSTKLEYLSITTWENVSSLFTETLSLPNLQHFTIESRNSFTQQSIPTLYTILFRALTVSPLKSITIKLSEPMIMADPFMTQLIVDHHATLTRFNCVNVDMTNFSLKLLARTCTSLEQLSISVPKGDEELEDFLGSLEHAQTLHTLIDISEAHSAHGSSNTLLASDISEIFGRIESLQKLITGNRSWSCTRIPIYADEIDGESNDYEDEDDIDNVDDCQCDYHRRRAQLNNKVDSNGRKIWDWDIKLRWEKLRLSKNPRQTLVEADNTC